MHIYELGAYGLNKYLIFKTFMKIRLRGIKYLKLLILLEQSLIFSDPVKHLKHSRTWVFVATKASKILVITWFYLSFARAINSRI